MPRSWTLVALVLVGSSGALAGSSSAAADGPDRLSVTRKQLAAERYDQAVAAFDAGDLARAGALFEAADEVEPSEIAREQAIRAYRMAGLEARAQALEAAPAVRPAASGAGEADEDGGSGAHREATTSAQTRGAADAPSSRSATHTTAPEGRDGGGLSPLAFYGALALTAAAGAATVWSADRMYDSADAFERALGEAEGGDPQAVGRARLARERVEGAELRTHVLLGATVTLGVSSALLAIFADWGDDDEAQTPQLRVAVDPSAVQVSLGGAL